jgi:outer membrane receptor protein involved in Fe transport
MADDVVTAVLLATRAPVLVAPSMNVNMWNHPLTQRNLQTLVGIGVHVVEPGEGFLACRWIGKGRLAEPAEIVEAAAHVLAPKDLAGRRVVVTAGPTHEAIDPVRFLGNRSSGKMGYAVAAAAARRGALVTLISGPTALPDPHGATTVRVETAREMEAALAGVGDGAAESSNTQFGLYIQDDWEVNEHLTLNLGVRWDYEKSPTYTDFVTPADVAAALRGWTNIQQPAAGYDIEDYISDGSQRDAFTTGIQPRLGFSWDFNGDERTVLFGGIGRSYDRNLFDRLQLELTKATFPTVNFFFDTPGHPCSGSNCLPWDPVYFNDGVLQGLAATSGAGREINLIHNDLKMPYSDQASLGIRHQIGGWQTEATISRVESHDGFMFLLGNRRPDGTFFAPGATWGAPWGFGVPGFGALILGTNGLETRANSLYLKAERPFTPDSPWGVTAAYTYTDAEENRQFGEHYSLDYPTIDGFGWKQAGGVPEHRLVLTGLYQGWYGIMFSGKYQIATAAPRYGTNCNEIGWNDCFPDQFKPDGVGYQQLDLAAYKEWDIGSGVRLKARVDILNVTNEYNWAGYDTWWGGQGEPQNPNLGTPDRSIAGPTRTVKISFGLLW